MFDILMPHLRNYPIFFLRIGAKSRIEYREKRHGVQFREGDVE